MRVQTCSVIPFSKCLYRHTFSCVSGVLCHSVSLRYLPWHLIFMQNEIDVAFLQEGAGGNNPAERHNKVRGGPNVSD